LGGTRGRALRRRPRDRPPGRGGGRRALPLGGRLLRVAGAVIVYADRTRESGAQDALREVQATAAAARDHDGVVTLLIEAGALQAAVEDALGAHEDGLAPEAEP